jgi:hypothetical protein
MRSENYFSALIISLFRGGPGSAFTLKPSSFNVLFTMPLEQ